MAVHGLPVSLGQGAGDYETVAASATDQVLGTLGAKGDELRKVVIVPATTGAGTVSVKDGTGGAINLFVTGTLADLKTLVIDLGMISQVGAWSITTGANVSVIAIGRFS